MDTSRFNSVPNNIQLANVGTSHGKASFDYQTIPYLGFNFAHGGRLLYDYRVIKQYIEHFDKNAVLFIPISYFQITRINTDYRMVEAAHYPFLDKQYIDNYSERKKIVYTYIPVLNADNEIVRIINERLMKPPEDLSQSMTIPELEVYSKRRYKSWTQNRQTEKEMGEEGFAYNKSLVSKMIELCLAHDIQPVLISTPITSVLNQIYAEESPDFFNTFYRFTRELQETYPAVPYFDYSHDPRFENDFSLFLDSDHLNAAGAKKFTALVVSDLQTSGLLPIIDPDY